jgi:uncharacterized protein YjbI with pentapeptide repeats
MANKEHLEILTHKIENRDIDTWNKWRKKNNKIQPDLSGANLDSADLIGADLRGTILTWAQLGNTNLVNAHLGSANLIHADIGFANLRHANLGGADLRYANFNHTNLSGADLSGADISGAILVEANLGGADLRYANFNHTNLSGADLSGAILVEANLNGAELTNADFHKAQIGRTFFADNDLSTIKNLEKVIHVYPSVIGIDTIYKSKGKIPEVFLRGAGVPDTMIEYIGSLVGKAIEYYSCFISYSSLDKDFADRLFTDLQNKGVRCWFAHEDMKIGDKIRPRIDESIRMYDKLLIILSEQSVTSDWVEKEVETAMEKERKEKRTALFPIRLDDAVMETDVAWAADIRRTRHIGDFRKWKDHDAYQKAFDRLMRDLKAETQIK